MQTLILKVKIAYSGESWSMRIFNCWWHSFNFYETILELDVDLDMFVLFIFMWIYQFVLSVCIIFSHCT